jgi:hypothetical protein
MPEDSFQANIDGVANLIGSDTNKVKGASDVGEGIEGDFEDLLELPMSDEELLELRDEWEGKSNGYLPSIKGRQKRNRSYLRGVQRNQTSQDDRVVSSNLLFEATATFVPQALAENPEPVVYSDNTDEGKAASDSLKTMLQFHGEQMALRKKLGVMIWQWSIYFTAALKYGWDEKVGDITVKVIKPENLIFDPSGYVDEFGDFQGEFLGERIETTAKKLVKEFPSQKTYITLKVNGKMGTRVVYTEWWTNKYCFSTYLDVVLDKHKNEFFNYEEEPNEFGSVTPTVNHFALPKMPYTLLSVFSLQEQPHDFTNLIEQNIANQDRINDRDEQISKNLASANNSVVLSGISFTLETAEQAVETFYQEGFLLVPDGNVENGVKRIPANEIPQSVFKAQDNDKENLRSIYGTLGLSAQPQDENTTARGQILNTNHDSSRIGGGVGDSLEGVAKNFFNWLPQLYAVFYDQPHYAAVMGMGAAVQYTQLVNSDLQRRFIISVAPNSMKPKDEVTQQNMALELAQQKLLDPISLFERLDDSDPVETAERVAMWNVNPQLYMQQYFGNQQQQQQAQQVGAGGAAAGGMPQDQGTPPPTTGAPPASDSLSNVPINTPAAPS